MISTTYWSWFPERGDDVIVNRVLIEQEQEGKLQVIARIESVTRKDITPRQETNNA